MHGFWKRTVAALVPVMAISWCGAAAFAQVPNVTPVPSAIGPIPVTSDSYPFMAANRIQAEEIRALSKVGYIEEEFIVSGTANVYDWPAAGQLTVRTYGLPYTTRILLRRPADRARFSGAVILETLNFSRSYDWAYMWAIAHPGMIEHGDAFVGITNMPQQIDALKKFNPQRYASLSMANPPTRVCGASNAITLADLQEEGLRWDIISQVGALLKSTNGLRPLAGFDVQRIYLTSHSGEILTYINAIHSRAKLANGKPVYDGYLIKTMQLPARINRCVAAPPEFDPRVAIKNVGVPIIYAIAQGDVGITLNQRRPDTDEPSDRLRWYEVAGVPHMDKYMYDHMPFAEDQVKAGQNPSYSVWPLPYSCTPPITLLDFPAMRYVLNAAFNNLDRWVKDGTPPPRAERIALTNIPVTPEAAARAGDSYLGTAKLDADQVGNAKGGVRSPYLDVPNATYIPHSPGPASCPGFGFKVPFDWGRMQTLYGTYQNYATKFSESVDKLVSERWFNESDGRRMKQDVAPRALPTPVAQQNWTGSHIVSRFRD